MRVAAGVLILVVAVMNLIGGCGYTVGGGLIGGGAGILDEAASELSKAAEESGDLEAAAELGAFDGSEAKSTGGQLMLWGVFLLILAGLQIAAGVQLFRAKGAVLIQTAAGLEILSDVITVAWFGSFIMSGLGLLTAIMAIVSVKEFSAAPAPVADPAPAPEAEPEAEAEAEPEAEPEAEAEAEADSD